MTNMLELTKGAEQNAGTSGYHTFDYLNPLHAAAPRLMYLSETKKWVDSDEWQYVNKTTNISLLSKDILANKMFIVNFQLVLNDCSLR